MKQIFTYTMFLLVILLSTGCSKENEPDASDKPVPSGEGMSTYVPIDWEQTDIQSFNPETGELSLVFTGGNVPTFEDGYSLLVVETDTSAYIRRVMQSAVSSNIARLQTIGADMTELFSNTEFSFSFTPSASRTETKAGTMASIDANGVLHPVKIVVQAEDGSFQTLYDIKTQTRAEDGSFIDLFNINMPGVAIGIPNGQVKLSWDSFKQQFQLKTDAYFRFSEAVQEKVIDENLKVKVSELEACRFSFDADVLSEMILRAEAHGEFSIGLDMLKFGIFGPTFVGFITPVGIPVLFTISAEMISDLSLKGEIDEVATGGISLTGGLTLGIDYDGSEWKSFGDARYDYTPHPLELRGEDKVEIEVSVYPRLSFKLYNFLGPHIAPKMYVNDKLASGYLFGSVGDDYCAWTEELSVGLKPDISVGVEFFGLEGSISLPMNPLAEAQLYNAPDNMTLVSPASGTKVEVGQPVAVRFNVTRKLVGMDLPVANVVVKFVSDSGTVDHELTITDPLGNADVLWTPQEQGASLRAEVYNADGKVILEETFTPDAERSIVGKWRQLSGVLTIEPPHDPLLLNNCLEFREDSTFSFEFNFDKTIGYMNMYDGKTGDWVGYVIGCLTKKASGTYRYANSEVTITSCPEYISELIGQDYLLANNYVPYPVHRVHEGDPSDFEGKVEFYSDNYIRIGENTYYERIVDDDVKSFIQVDTQSSQQSFRLVDDKLVPFKVK